MKRSQLRQDVFGGFGPHKGLGVGVVPVEILIYGIYQFQNAAKYAPTNALLGQFREESLNQVQPRRRSRRKVNALLFSNVKIIAVALAVFAFLLYSYQKAKTASSEMCYTTLAVPSGLADEDVHSLNTIAHAHATSPRCPALPCARATKTTGSATPEPQYPGKARAWHVIL